MRTALIAVGTVGAVWLLVQVWQILLVIVVGLMFVGMLNPIVERLEKRGLRRGTAIAIVFVTLLLLVGGFFGLTLPRLVSQASDLLAHSEQARGKVVHQLASLKLTAPLADAVRKLDLNALSGKAKDYGLAYGPHALEIAAYGVSSVFLGLYILIDRDRMRGSLFALVPRAHHVRLSRVLMHLETIVGGYMRGQAITSLLMAVFTFVVLTIAGVSSALPLALFAGLADVLPYVGALLACGPAVLATLAKGPTIALVVLAVLAAYQELESRIIIPRVYGRVLRLPAATVMVALLIGGQLLGILGALLALPIAAAIRMIIAELRFELPGEELDDAELREKDAVAQAEFEVRAAGKPAEVAAEIATEIAANQDVPVGDERDAGAGAAALAPQSSG